MYSEALVIVIGHVQALRISIQSHPAFPWGAARFRTGVAIVFITLETGAFVRGWLVQPSQQAASPTHVLAPPFGNGPTGTRGWFYALVEFMGATGAR